MRIFPQSIFFDWGPVPFDPGHKIARFDGYTLHIFQWWRIGVCFVMFDKCN